MKEGGEREGGEGRRRGRREERKRLRAPLSLWATIENHGELNHRHAYRSRTFCLGV